MSEDLRSAVQMLAADNARLCDRLITAEAVVEFVRAYANEAIPTPARRHILKLVAAHDAGRPS
jgi:hypothetical protein